MTDEIDRFKSEISLSDFAQSEFGYELIKKDSSKSSLVLKCGGDKIIITRQPDGHDVYFSVGDERDNGSIIDFLQRRKNVNLGLVRKELRAWLPGSKKPSIRVPQRPPERAVAVERDRADVLRQWASMQPYAGSYLTDERCIDWQTITAFDVRQDERGNACFAHRTGDGITGWEVKNRGHTRFATGGLRTLSLARLDAEPVTRIVVTEGAIDAMSYAQMHCMPGAAYISTGGSLSALQADQIKNLMVKNPAVEFVLAMDRDKSGVEMAAAITAFAPHGAIVLRHVPEVGKDWNEALQAAVAREIVQGNQQTPRI